MEFLLMVYADSAQFEKLSQSQARISHSSRKPPLKKDHAVPS